MFLNIAIPWASYTIGEAALKNSVCEHNFTVFIDTNLTFDTHIAETVNKVNRILGLFKCNFQ
jgi:hypothetical protein